MNVLHQSHTDRDPVFAAQVELLYRAAPEAFLVTVVNALLLTYVQRDIVASTVPDYVVDIHAYGDCSTDRLGLELLACSRARVRTSLVERLVCARKSVRRTRMGGCRHCPLSSRCHGPSGLTRLCPRGHGSWGCRGLVVPTGSVHGVYASRNPAHSIRLLIQDDEIHLNWASCASCMCHVDSHRLLIASHDKIVFGTSHG